jgi:hypothetical protein
MDDHRTEAEKSLHDNNSYPEHSPESVATSLRALAEGLLAVDDSLRRLVDAVEHLDAD